MGVDERVVQVEEQQVAIIGPLLEARQAACWKLDRAVWPFLLGEVQHVALCW